jgi:hypothetical protein
MRIKVRILTRALASLTEVSGEVPGKFINLSTGTKAYTVLYWTLSVLETFSATLFYFLNIWLHSLDGGAPDARPLTIQYSTTQKNEENIHVASGIQTHDPSVQSAKAHKFYRRTQWPRCLRRVVTTAQTLRLWFRIPLEHWICHSVSLCCVFHSRTRSPVKCRADS